MHDDPARHRDRGWRLSRFAGTILVVCPRCGGRASAVTRPGLPELRYYTEYQYRPRRLVCAGCGVVAEWEAEFRGGALYGATLGGTEDPFFGQPLWLQVRCAGRILWAYNAEHVTELAEYLAARHRERGALRPTMSLFARLPRWMKVAAHRDEVLAGLAKLQELADRSMPADRSAAAHAHDVHPRPRRESFYRGRPY
ncbi:hypothetical protein [Actinokineospora auranticolor]|uniref:hypothetical protein n=1 Tax=Actinokineospora auranticolor TaxID=155976 RepID=UPI001CA53064|nr:hypothetical protein [Actinokineospora auranticolor]